MRSSHNNRNSSQPGSASASASVSGSLSSPVSSTTSSTVHVESPSPLRTISDNSNTSGNAWKKISASQIVMNIIDSPRRAIMGKKRSAYDKMKDWADATPLFSPMGQTSYEPNDDRTKASMDIDIVGQAYGCHPSVLSWIELETPQDIIPKILSFAGPQKIQVLSKVNRFWRDACLSEAVFKTICEDTGKWVEGKDAEPLNDVHMDGDDEYDHGCDKHASDDSFWRQYYCRNPIVPIDYPTIPKAVAAVCKQRTHNADVFFSCDKDVRILVQPGVYIIDSQITVETVGDTLFSVETLEPRTCEYEVAPILESSARSGSDRDGSSNTPRRRKLSGAGLRDLFTCRSTSSADDGSEESETGSRHHVGDQATVVLRTKKPNTPIFHIRQGQMRLSKMNLIHNCSGTDIWNGNSAVQIQPRYDDRLGVTVPAEPNKLPSAIVEETKIMSISGRGIVAIDGSIAHVRNCHIHGCAATGIYIGGPGSVANVANTDVVNNGMGNKRTRRGITRGHSGVYLEQGAANLANCNISHNSLTGISAVSPTNAFLKIWDSDLVGNGADQLEMPPRGSVSFSNSSSINNNTVNAAIARTRYGLHVEEDDESDLSDGI